MDRNLLLIIQLITGLQIGAGFLLNNEVCYEELGCFNTNGFTSLSRPINFLSNSREKINTQFLLYTRQNVEKESILKAGDKRSIINSYFNASLPVKFVTHGYLEDGWYQWLQNLVKAFLKHGDYNVIDIDWGGGSKPPYAQAVANARVVGAEIALLISYLQDEFGVAPESCHFVGHSLGAHIGGYAGKRLHSLGRITGLDPSAPFFQNTDPIVRLDSTDALLVDVIHTNIGPLGFGMSQSVGHLDFYPNGGDNQPGCDKTLVSSIILEDDIYFGGRRYIGCDHIRAYEFFTESLTSKCPFISLECPNIKEFEDGNCIACGQTGEKCVRMGIGAENYLNTNHRKEVKFYSKTGNEDPFCRYQYRIQIILDDTKENKNLRATFEITLITSSGKRSALDLTDVIVSTKPGLVYNIMEVSIFLGDISAIEFSWTHHVSVLDPISWTIWKKPELYLDKVNLFSLEEQTEISFCSREHNLRPNVKIQLSICNGNK